jgi:hypothetical protein
VHLQHAAIFDGSATVESSSIAIEGDRIAELSSRRDGVDLAGRRVTPGLIDAHLHLLEGGRALTEVDLRGCRSQAEFERRITAAHHQLNPGAWLIARGWSQSDWGGDVPTKAWLSQAANRPVVCYRMDLHAAVVNDAVLDQLSLPTPAEIESLAGRFDRDQDGVLTGHLVEAAMWEYLNPVVPPRSIEQLQIDLHAAQAACHRVGVTAVRTMEYAASVQSVFAPLANALTLRCQIVLLDRKALPSREVIPHLPPDGNAQVIGFKAFLDGTLGSRTARLHCPYADVPQTNGLFLETAAEGDLLQWATAVATTGQQIVMHAIGDAAVSLALDVADHFPAEVCTIEHAELIDPRDVPRLAGKILSMQPLHRGDDARFASAALGEGRASRLCAFASNMKEGATLVFGSDWPVVSVDPVRGMHAAITGLDLLGRPFHCEQAISPAAALQAYTTDAAKVIDLPMTGRIHPGMMADLVVWNEDPLTHDWLESMPTIAATIVGGRVVYSTLPQLEVN